MKHSLRPLTLLALGAAVVPAKVFAKTHAPNDQPNYHLVQQISLPGEGGWDLLTLDSAARRLYIARSTHVTVLNVDSGKVVGEIADLAGVHGVAVDHRSGRGFTSNGHSNSVTIFNLKTLKKIAEVPVGQGPDTILYDAATRTVWTFNAHSQDATVLDAATGKVTGTVALSGQPEFAVSDGQGHIYNNLEDKNAIAQINAKTLKVENVWPLGVGEGPSGLAFDAKNRRLFAVCENGKMVVMNADNGAVVATPAIGNGPDACAFDAGTKLVFSPNGRDGTMTILRETTPDTYETVATISTRPGARTMALDEATHRLFSVSAEVLPDAPAATPTPDAAASATASPAPAPRRMRRYAPGSFVVLEYGP